MERHHLIQPREDDAHEFDSAHHTTDGTPRSGTQPHVSAVRDTTVAQPLYQATGQYEAKSYDEFSLPIYGEDQLAVYPTGDTGVPLASEPFSAPLLGHSTINTQLHAPPYDFDLYRYGPSTAGVSAWVPSQQASFLEWVSLFSASGPIAGPSTFPHSFHDTAAQDPRAIAVFDDSWMIDSTPSQRHIMGAAGQAFVGGLLPMVADTAANVSLTNITPTMDILPSSERLKISDQPTWLPSPPFSDKTNAHWQPGRQRGPHRIKPMCGKRQDKANACDENQSDTHQGDTKPFVSKQPIDSGDTFLRVDVLEDDSVDELNAQLNNNHTHGDNVASVITDSFNSNIAGCSRVKVKNRARKERANARQKRTATVTPATTTTPQLPTNWCDECKFVIPGGVDNFKVHVRREHERPDVLPCTLCGEEFSAHRGAEFFTLHLFGKRRWTQCSRVKEVYGVTGRRDRVEVTSNNIDLLGRWIVQHRQDLVNANFTSPGQWPIRSTISRMLRRWSENNTAGSDTALTAGPSTGADTGRGQKEEGEQYQKLQALAKGRMHSCC